jgi:hypothetical protein
MGPLRNVVLVHHWPHHYDSTEPLQPSEVTPVVPLAHPPDPPAEALADTPAKPPPLSQPMVPQDWRPARRNRALEEARVQKRLQKLADHNARVPFINSHLLLSISRRGLRCEKCNKLYNMSSQWQAYKDTCKKWAPSADPSSAPPPTPAPTKRTVPPERLAKAAAALAAVNAKKWKQRLDKHNASADSLGKHILEDSGEGCIKCSVCTREWTKGGRDKGFRLPCPRNPAASSQSKGRRFLVTQADKLRSQSAVPGRESDEAHPPAPKKPRQDEIVPSSTGEGEAAEEEPCQPPPAKRPRRGQ